MQDLWLTIDGCAIRYRDTGGAGVAVLFSHGIAASLEMWDLQMTKGLSHLRLIAWDFPNHGLSDMTGKTEDFDSYALWAQKFAQALNLDRFIAVGNSMGAAVSLRLATQLRLRGVVLANAAALGPEVTPVFRLFSLPFVGEALNKPSEKTVALQIKAIVKDPNVVTPRLRAAIARNVAKQGGTAAFLATLRATLTLRGQNKKVWQKSHGILSALDCPALVIHGKDDAVLPHKHSAIAAGLAAQSQLLIVHACGHTPQVEKPELFNQALADFARSLG